MRYVISLLITGLIFLGIFSLLMIAFPNKEENTASLQTFDKKISNFEENSFDQKLQTLACPWVSDIMYGRMLKAFTIEKEALEKINDSFKWERVEFISNDPWEGKIVSGESLVCIYEKLTPLPEYGPNYFGRESIQVTLKNDFFAKTEIDNQNDLWKRFINLHDIGTKVSCESSREECRFTLEKKPKNLN